MTFETLPVVHLDDGRLPEYPDQSPDRVLTSLARRFGRVVIVDVSGVRANQADLEFIQEASRRRAIWADGGSRYATDAMDLFVAGAEGVTIRWNTLDSEKELREAADIIQPGTLYLALEYPGGTFLKNKRDARDAHEVVRLAESLSVGLVFILDAADESLLRRLPTAATPRYVQSPADPAVLQSMGFQGAMVAPARLPPEAP